MLPRDLVLELADADGTFARRPATICAQRARLTHEMLYSRVAKSTIARLAAALLPFATRAAGPMGALEPLPSMSQSELASAVGTVKDVVGRDLSALRDAGAIDLRGGRVARIDVAKLRRADRATTSCGIDRCELRIAHQALTVGKPALADSYIARALSDQTKMARIARTDGTSMVIPVFTELDDTATLTNALKHPARRDARERDDALVRRNAVDVASVAIDVTKARARLDAARMAIADHNTRAAQKSLTAIGTDLVVSSVAANVPLLTAREDLSLAQNAIDRNRPKIAAADLRGAATALGRYNSAAHSKDVRSLASTIDAEASLTRRRTRSNGED